MGDDDTATVESLIGGPTNGRRTTTGARRRRTPRSVQIGGLVDREYRLGLDRRGDARAHEGRTVRAGARDVRIVFERTAERRLDGKVLSSRGQPVSGRVARPDAPDVRRDLDVARPRRARQRRERKFAFEGVRGTELVVWIRGRRRGARMLPVPDAIGEEGFTVTVAVRCHFKVHLSGTLASADRLRVLDAEGAEMDLMDITPNGVTTMKHASIVGGLSAIAGCRGAGVTLSILRTGPSSPARPAPRPGDPERDRALARVPSHLHVPPEQTSSACSF
jgi:hypothetical protein